MTQLITSTVERLTFPGMEIRLRLERAPVAHYDPSPQEQRQRCWVEVNSDLGPQQLLTIEGFCGLLSTVSPAALASDAPTAARIAAFLLGFGRVVSNHELYKYLEAPFGIQLSSRTPRLEGMHPKFLAIKADLRHATQELRDDPGDCCMFCATMTLAFRRTGAALTLRRRPKTPQQECMIIGDMLSIDLFQGGLASGSAELEAPL